MSLASSDFVNISFSWQWAEMIAIIFFWSVRWTFQVWILILVVSHPKPYPSKSCLILGLDEMGYKANLTWAQYLCVCVCV